MTLEVEQSTAAAAVVDRKPTGGKAGRILCWILAHPGAHDTNARAFNATWGRQCDILLFITTTNHPTLNTVVLDIGGPESRDRLWIKSKRAWEVHLTS